MSTPTVTGHTGAVPLAPPKGDSDVRGRTPDQVVRPQDTLLEVKGLKKYFPIRSGLLSRTTGQVKAVDGVTFYVRRGETLGLVGESGSGKTTAGRALLRLIEPTAGSVHFDGKDVVTMGREDLRVLRRRAQIVFQDPYGSLNPRMTVGDTLREVLTVHKLARGAAAQKRVRELLEVVGLLPQHIGRYPHEFSGGQRQRIGIARALAMNPEFIVCDEAVSALDVSIQAQVINLLERLQSELDLSYVFVAHDLSVVRHIADRVAVMYLGKVVEIADEKTLYERPTHPYTQALLSAVPVPDPTMRGQRDQIVLSGDLPSPANPPSGCRFRTRCWKAEEICAQEEPALVDRPADPHPSACHFAEVRNVVHATD